MPGSTSDRSILLSSEDWSLFRTPLRQPGDQTPPDLDGAPRLDDVAVPGQVHTQAGHTDLWIDVPSLTSLNHDEWSYFRTFETPTRAPGDRMILELDGSDYFTDVFVNGVFVGHHEGMFARREFDVTDAVRQGEPNELLICVSCPWTPEDRFWFLQPSTVFSVILTNTEYMKGNLLHYWDGLPMSGQTSFPFGLWRDVRLTVRPAVSLVDMNVATLRVTDDAATLGVTVAVENFTGASVALELSVVVTDPDGVPQPSHHQQIVAEPFRGEYSFELEEEAPRLWWTWDTGEQPLYEAAVSVAVDGVELLQTASKTFGIRTFERDPETQAYHLNGQRLFLRGSWYPFANIFPALVKPGESQRDVRMLRDGNQNHIVVFTFVEDASLYEACDQTGILIFQELPFTQLGPMNVVDESYPRYREHWECATSQVADVVRQLRSHPSVVVWGAFAETQKEGRWVWGDYTEFVEELRGIVNSADPDAIFHPSFCDFGEEHIWNGGFPFGEYWDHYDRDHHFISEFGGISPPVPETLHEFISEADSWGLEEYRAGRLQLPINVEEYSYRWAFDYAGLATSTARMYHHAHRNPRSLEEFLDAIQWYQAFGLQYCAEVYRRKRFNSIGGARTWSYRENTPGAKFTVVDHRQRPKIGYYGLKAGYAPVLLSIDDQFPLRPLGSGTSYERDLWLINDTPWPLELRLKATLRGVDGSVHWEHEWASEAPADGHTTHPISFDVPAAGLYRLEVVGQGAGGEVVTEMTSWMRSIDSPLAKPLGVLLIGQARYNAPVLEALADVPGLTFQVLDEVTRHPQDHSWHSLASTADVVWFTGWDTAVHRFHEADWKAIRDAVETGAGFIHTGGQGSFHGGDGRGAQLDATPLGELLPLTLIPHDGVWDRVYVPESVAEGGHELPLQEFPVQGFSRTIADPAADVSWTIGGFPLLVTGSFGRGKVVAFTASLTKPLRMFRIGEGLDWEDPLDVDPHWSRADIRAYGPYWSHNLELTLAMLAMAADTELTDSVASVAEETRKPLFEALSGLPMTTLAAVATVNTAEGTGMVDVENTGPLVARLTRGTVMAGDQPDPEGRFLDGFCDLMPGERVSLRFECGEALAGRGSVSLRAQNSLPCVVSL